MRDAFVTALVQAAEADPRIVIITGDLGFNVLDEFQRRLPKQFINAGVAEQNMTGLAAGLAMEDFTVFTYSIANFSTLRCLEQIRNDLCYHQLNVNIVAVGGGLSYGPLGPTHHATEDIAIMRALPEMVVFCPNDDRETAWGVGELARRPGPSYIRLDRNSVLLSEEAEPSALSIGRARLICDGSDLTLIATGGLVVEAVEAARILSQQSLKCRVVSMHTIRPLDETAIREAALETGGIVTIEEHSVVGGLGSAVADCLVDAHLSSKLFFRIGLPSAFTSLVGSQEYLRRNYGLDAPSIASRIISAMSERT